MEKAIISWSSFLDSLAEEVKKAEQENVVMANAGLAITTSDPNMDIKDAIEKASESLKSGKALKTFTSLIELSSKSTPVQS